jgi:hypothetical protein
MDLLIAVVTSHLAESKVKQRQKFIIWEAVTSDVIVVAFDFDSDDKSA